MTSEEILEAIGNMSVLELVELKKAFEEKFDVTAAAAAPMMMAASGGGGGEAAAEAKDEFDVVLTAAGEKKIQVIKEVRGLTSLGLKEAKDLAAKVNIAGKDVYQMDRSFDVMDKAAQNEGTMGGTMGAGMGMGMGFGMGNVMGNMTGNMNTGQQNKQGQGAGSTPPPPPSGVQYFVLINNQQNGPHNLESMKMLITQNQINRETLVWKEGMSDWDNIMDQDDLNVLFSYILNTNMNTPQHLLYKHIQQSIQ